MKRTMKYADLTLGMVEAVFNKLGGIKGAKRFLMGDTEVVIRRRILQRQPFDPVSFLGNGWKIDVQVSRREGSNLDAGQIVCRDYLRQGESYINSEERLERIKEATGDVQLDGSDFLALWQEKGHATLNCLYETKGISWLSFWGVILRSPVGRCRILYLYHGEDGSWHWDDRWLGSDWNAGHPAAVLASN